jgi:hypothetical protein
MSEKPKAPTAVEVAAQLFSKLGLTTPEYIVKEPGRYTVTRALEIAPGHYICVIAIEDVLGETERVHMVEANRAAILEAASKEKPALVKTVYLYNGAHMNVQRLLTGTAGFNSGEIKPKLGGVVALIIGNQRSIGDMVTTSIAKGARIIFDSKASLNTVELVDYASLVLSKWTHKEA